MPSEVLLSKLAAGATGTVVAIRGGRQVHDRLRALGIRPGVPITKVSGNAAFGPVVVKHGQAQTALGRGVCGKVLVEIP